MRHLGRSSLAPGPRRSRLSSDSDPLPRGGRCYGPAPPTSQAVGALCAPGRGAPPSAPGPSGTAARRRHRRASFRPAAAAERGLACGGGTGVSSMHHLQNYSRYFEFHIAYFYCHKIIEFDTWNIFQHCSTFQNFHFHLLIV